MPLSGKVWVCGAGGGHWAGECCVTDGRQRLCRKHRTRVTLATTLWQSVAAAAGGWECPLKHVVFGAGYEDHLKRCKEAGRLRAAMATTSSGLVSSVGHAELQFDSAEHGVTIRLAFHDGSLRFATAPSFFPPSPTSVAVDVTVSDVNVCTVHTIVIAAAGPVTVVPLPAINAALYCVNREVTITWRPPSPAIMPQPAAQLLRPSSGDATGRVGSGSTEGQES